MAAPKQSVADLAAVLGLRETDTHQVINYIANDILITMYGHGNAARDKLIEQVYSEWNNGAKWGESRNASERDMVTSTFLIGPPGHGKTTAFKVASSKVAKALNMRYLENAALDEAGTVTDDDFVFVTQETAGIVSALEWLGLPRAQQLPDGSGEVMGRLYSARLFKAAKAGGSTILFDDFLNASPSIQNVGLSISEEKRFNDLSLVRSYIGLTGNLGAHDGTLTSQTSTALRNRCEMIFVQDNLQNFRSRAQSRWKDEIGDAAVLGFLNRHDDMFSEMPDPKQRGGFATPRSWDKFIVTARRCVRAAGGNLALAMKDLDMKASYLLGLRIGQAYTAYMNAYIKSADPLARAAIMEGKLDKEEFKAKMKDGLSAEGQYFAYQFAMALSDYAVAKVVQDKGEIGEAVKRFAAGAMMIDQANFNFAIDNFKRSLAMKFENLSTKVSENRRELKMDVKQEISNIFVKDPSCTDQHRENLISVLSDMAMHETGLKRRQRKTGGAAGSK